MGAISNALASALQEHGGEIRTNAGVQQVKVTGGKAIYGASVGILMLEARFPRIPGDMGHAITWDFPVLYRVVRDASPDRVVRRNAEGLLPRLARIEGLDSPFMTVHDRVDAAMRWFGRGAVAKQAELFAQ